MIITKIRLEEEHPMAFTGAGGTTYWPLPSCDLNLDSSAGENGYLIKAAEGFGPPSVTAIVEGFDATGIPIFGPAMDTRTVSLRIGLVENIDKTVSELRDDLYKFMSKSVIISFMNDALTVAQISGFIREFDPTHFASQPEIKLLIECTDGVFTSPIPVNIPVATLNTLSPVIVYNEGTAPTGMVLIFEVTVNHSNFSITNHGKAWHSGSGAVNNNFTVTYPFLDNDIVTLSTHPKDKRLTVLRGANTVDLAGYLNSGAVWPQLYSGVNAFGWTFDNTWMLWTGASYIPRYWGV